MTGAAQRLLNTQSSRIGVEKKKKSSNYSVHETDWK